MMSAKLRRMAAILRSAVAATTGLMLSTMHMASIPAWAQNASSSPRFEVASVRLNTSSERPRFRVNAVAESGRLTLTSVTVREVILSAYGLQPFELVANDSPVLTQRIDIVAKATTPTTVAEMQRMLQPLLEERFRLAVHREMREMDALLLVRVDERRLGPKIKTSTLDCQGLGTTNSFAFSPGTSETVGKPRCGVMPADGPGHIVANGIDMRGLANELAPSQGRPVVDTTGLTSRYDVDVTYTPEVFSAAALARRGATAPSGVDPDGPPLATALRDQLGLKLESKRASVIVVVIDRIEVLIPD